MANAFQSSAFQEQTGFVAFQQNTGVTVNAGSSISGGYWSKGKWHKLKKEVELERFAEAEAARKEKESERREAALTPVQRAERDVARCQAECARFAQAFSANPSRHALDRFNEAVGRLEQATVQVAHARRADAQAKAKTAADRAKAERELQRQEHAEALALHGHRQAIAHAMASYHGARHLLQTLGRIHINEAAYRARQQVALEAAHRAAQDDDETALALLLLH